jgi:hypothetical protein
VTTCRTIAHTGRQRMKPYIRWMLLIAVLNWFFAWLAWDSGPAPVAHSLMLWLIASCWPARLRQPPWRPVRRSGQTLGSQDAGIGALAVGPTEAWPLPLRSQPWRTVGANCTEDAAPAPGRLRASLVAWRRGRSTVASQSGHHAGRGTDMRRELIPSAHLLEFWCGHRLGASEFIDRGVDLGLCLR